MYIPPDLTIKKIGNLCTQYCVSYDSHSYQSGFLYSSDQLLFIMETPCVYYEVGTLFLYAIYAYMSLRLKRLKLINEKYLTRLTSTKKLSNLLQHFFLHLSLKRNCSTNSSRLRDVTQHSTYCDCRHAFETFNNAGLRLMLFFFIPSGALV